MNITTTETTSRQVEVEAEFPIYRRTAATETANAIYSLIEQTCDTLRKVSVEIETDVNGRDCRAKISVDYNYRPDGENTDYALGRGKYALSPSEFQDVFGRLLGMMSNEFAESIASMKKKKKKRTEPVRTSALPA